MIPALPFEKRREMWEEQGRRARRCGKRLERNPYHGVQDADDMALTNLKLAALWWAMGWKAEDRKMTFKG